jgi:uncharacterized protein (TIGR02118 family)
MAGIKLIVAYPMPTDVDTFEKRYNEEHIPMAAEKLAGKTKLVASKILSMADGSPAPFYRIAEVHFPSAEVLGACAESEGGKETIGHAVEISTGGTPLFMVAEEEVINF